MTQDDETGNLGGDLPSQGPEAAAEATAIANGAASATADGMNEASNEAAGLAEAAVERFAEAGADAATTVEQAQSRLEQAGVPGAAASRVATDQFKAASDLLSERVTQGFGQSQSAMVAFNSKVVEAWRTNAEATIAYWQRLSGVTNWSDLVALNTAHLRQQIETVTAQTRELADLAAKTARGNAPSLTNPRDLG